MSTLPVSSMKDYCQVIFPFLQSTLVSDEALGRICDITELLPPFSPACLECRLASDQPRVDFLADIRHGTLSIPQKFLTHPLWRDIDRLYRDWSEPSSLLHQTLRNLCLEFDLEINNQTPEILVPCLFLGFNSDVINDVDALKEILNALPPNLLSNQPNSSQFYLKLKQCIDNLPERAIIAHLGIMLSRPTQEIRLHIKGIPLLQIPKYLTQIGWTSPLNELKSLIKKLSEFVDYTTLDLDIGEQIGLQIGIECYLEKQPPDESRWCSFLEYLIAEELCTSAKKDALLMWPGITQKNDCPENWPSNLLLGDRFLGPVALSLFYRRIYHIKIVYHPDLPLAAKVYLEFGHHWIERDLLENTQSQEVM